MAPNVTTSSNGLMGPLTDGLEHSPGKLFIAMGVVLIAFVLHKLSSPTLDVCEPPLLKPRVPIIGHLVGLLKYQNTYMKRLHDRYHRQIATLPILGGKLYVIFDPVIIQSSYRKKALSFEPYAAEFAQRMLLLTNETTRKLKETTLVQDFFAAIHPSMTGDYLHRMNANALNYIAKELNNIGDPEDLDLPNTWYWLRDTITMATTEALYGPENPLREDPSLLNDIWAFDAGLNLLLINILPSITAPKPHKARARLQAALGKYYGARKYEHEDAAQIVKGRASAFVKHDVPDEEAGRIELALLHVGTANTIPTLYWFFVHVFSRPELVKSLRDEVTPAVKTDGETQGVIDITILDQKCPLLTSCYREAIRLSSQATGNRRVLEDTLVTDSNGKSYLLKKGENVQMSALVGHTLDVWGEDISDFKPDRFIESGLKENSANEKAKRAAYIPFGGGRSLCPGRNFAFAENLGLVACLLAGFDVTLTGPGFPVGMDCDFSQAALKPANNGQGYGVKIQRRERCEKICWSFIS
ncbi:hypothetical protein FGRMN_2524 [Fusarium graminum]|nr:hypothetical protein FGRMN_2524 [Fusarium graminum]